MLCHHSNSYLHALIRSTVWDRALEGPGEHIGQDLSGGGSPTRAVHSEAAKKRSSDDVQSPTARLR
jgi:hypothetical protein